MRGRPDSVRLGDSFEPAFVTRVARAIASLAARCPEAKRLHLCAAPSTLTLFMLSCPSPLAGAFGDVELHLSYDDERLEVDTLVVLDEVSMSSVLVFDVPGLSDEAYDVYSRLRLDGTAPARARALALEVVP